MDVLQLLQVERNCIELSENMLTLIVALDTAVHNLAKLLASFTVSRATFRQQTQGHVTNNRLQFVAVVSVYGHIKKWNNDVKVRKECHDI